MVDQILFRLPSLCRICILCCPLWCDTISLTNGPLLIVSALVLKWLFLNYDDIMKSLLVYSWDFEKERSCELPLKKKEVMHFLKIFYWRFWRTMAWFCISSSGSRHGANCTVVSKDQALDLNSSSPWFEYGTGTTTILNRGSHSSPVSPGNGQDGISIRQWLLPSKSFPIHQSSITLTTLWYMILTLKHHLITNERIK